jgi:hypothetical protein
MSIDQIRAIFEQNHKTLPDGMVFFGTDRFGTGYELHDYAYMFNHAWGPDTHTSQCYPCYVLVYK